MVVYSIGHSNQSFEQFLSLLRMHDIQVLADVRSAPYSRYVPHFNARQLRAAVLDAGLKYVYLGRELGGRPDYSPELYDEDGHALYSRISQTPLFREGIERLIAGVSRFRVAMMCSEEDPTDCHRRLLVATVLSEAGIPTLHIRGDGHLDNEADLPQPAHTQPLQASIFGDVNRDVLWRSTRSVLPRSPERFFGLLKQHEIRRLIDIRLNNSGQLAGFTKQGDLEFFLRSICDAGYVHQPLLAPTKELLIGYRKGDYSWGEYESQFDRLLRDREIESTLDRSLFDNRSVLLCSEPTPEQCHRRLVAEYLQRHWPAVSIVHL